MPHIHLPIPRIVHDFIRVQKLPQIVPRWNGLHTPVGRRVHVHRATVEGHLTANEIQQEIPRVFQLFLLEFFRVDTQNFGLVGGFADIATVSLEGRVVHGGSVAVFGPDLVGDLKAGLGFFIGHGALFHVGFEVRRGFLIGLEGGADSGGESGRGEVTEVLDHGEPVGAFVKLPACGCVMGLCVGEWGEHVDKIVALIAKEGNFSRVWGALQQIMRILLTYDFIVLRLISQSISGSMTDWLNDWSDDRMFDWLVHSNDLLIDWLVDSVSHWVNNWLIDWLIDELYGFFSIISNDGVWT